MLGALDPVTTAGFETDSQNELELADGTMDAIFCGSDRGLAHVGLGPVSTPERSVCLQPCGSPSAAAATDFVVLFFLPVKDRNLHEFGNSLLACAVTDLEGPFLQFKDESLH